MTICRKSFPYVRPESCRQKRDHKGNPVIIRWYDKLVITGGNANGENTRKGYRKELRESRIGRAQWEGSENRAFDCVFIL